VTDAEALFRVAMMLAATKEQWAIARRKAEDYRTMARLANADPVRSTARAYVEVAVNQSIEMDARARILLHDIDALEFVLQRAGLTTIRNESER
jgi:hypothetical protein